MITQRFRARKGRPLSVPPAMLAIWLAMCLTLSACAGVLLGGGSQSRPALGSDSRNSAQVAADDAVAARVRQRLNGDPAVRTHALTVQTVNGRVILYGTVDSYAARDQAVRLAQSESGVRSVDSRIRVDTRADDY